MTDLREPLQTVQLLVFAATALAGLRLWWRQRSRPAGFLAAAFGLLALVLLGARFLPAATSAEGIAAVARDLIVIGLAFFPWLFALFAWSFEHLIPRWLAAAGAAVVAVSVWALFLPPLPEAGEPRTPVQAAFVAVFIAVWAVLTLATAVKLWRAGGSQPLVRSRMRLMSAGALALTVALLLAGTADRADSGPLDVAIHLLTIASAMLFAAGFAPPRPLRLWWRRRATAQWQQMQLDLIAAITPEQVARAAVPVVADVLGVGAAVLTDDGRILARAGLDDTAADEVAARVPTSRESTEREQWVPVSTSWMVVQTTPYTPLFGQDERDLVAGFALQLRLALERSQLFRSNEDARIELERSHDEAQAMMVGLAHDLRSPMVSISGYTSLLRDTEDAEEREQMLDRIDANTEHLRQLVDSLVELSRVGRTQTEREPVDLTRIVDKVETRLSEAHPGATVEVGDLPVVTANPLAMEQVFDNLLTNAARHGGRGDITIRITAEVSDTAATIDVVDDGRGIEPDEREAVFAPFRRGRSAGGRGSGVGLGLVRRIVESHGGTIALVDDDRGAHFRLRLPTTAAGVPLATHPEPPGEEG